jgi:hypothetical protein
MSLGRSPSGASSGDPQPIAVRIFESALAPRETFFIDGNTELLRHRIDVVDVQVNKRVGSRVSRVFGQVEPNATAGYRNEPRKARLELMLPLLPETEALIPRNGPVCILDTEYRHDLLVHAASLRDW